MARTTRTGEDYVAAAPRDRLATAFGRSSNPIAVNGGSSPVPVPALAPAPADAAILPTPRAGLRSAKNPNKAAQSQHKTKSSQCEKVSKKTKTKAKPKPKPTKKECIICVTTRQVGHSAGRGFKEVEGSCEHFQNTCNVCIAKMVKEKITKRDLEEAVLVCPFSECEYVLDYNSITEVIFKGARENLDTALLQHHMRNSDNYITCLNPKCGLYFSIEDCQDKLAQEPKSDRGQKAACPYCEEDMCMKCMRPWHKSNCTTAEEKISLEAIQSMGAKACPKCGAKIQKNGGCNHMVCRQCNTDFCFGCLVTYSPNMKHADTCVEARTNIAHDPGNWLPDGVNPDDAWLLALMGGVLNPHPGAAPPPPRPQPNPVSAPKQAIRPRGFVELLQMLHNKMLISEINGNANVEQGQP